MTEYRIGDLVDITIKGVRIARPRSATSVTITDEYDIAYQMPPQAAIERVAPAEWPPRPGDVWSTTKRSGPELVFAVSDANAVLFINSGGYTYSTDDALAKRSPLTLVHREGNQRGPVAFEDPLMAHLAEDGDA